MLENRGRLTVYKIQNLKKSSEIRVVHRNLLMKCDQLPDDAFNEPVQLKKKLPKKKGKPKEVKEDEFVVNSDEDSDEEELVVRRRRTDEVLSEEVQETDTDATEEVAMASEDREEMLSEE